MTQMTSDRLKYFLSYDPNTGEFRRKTVLRGHGKVGQIAGGVDKDGYIQIRVDGKQHRAHRLAWLYVHGEMPEHEIDHINGIRTDNRIDNLRAASDAINAQNVRQARTDNKSTGRLGVYPNGSKFRAVITVSGKLVHLGQFDSAEEASSAYVAAKRKFHLGCTL